MRALPLRFFVAAAFVVASGMLRGADHASLAAEFKSPPDSAKPRTWWHWTMSNVTKDGITKDLEWMKRVGLGGFQLADVNVGRGQNVEPKTPFGTPEWYEAVRHAAAEADRLGLEMGIFSSPGWSETGGPWVKPEEGMKKYVWSETHVKGPTKFSGRLPAPPSNIGQIRNTGASYYGDAAQEQRPFYGDAAVVAYRTPAGDSPANPKPRVTTHAGPVDGSALLDDSLGTLLTIEAPADGGVAWVQYEYTQPFSARAFTIGGRGGSANGIPVGRVLASDDGQNFRSLVTLPGAQLYRQGMVRTYAFPPTAAKYFRLELTGAPLGPAATMSQAPASPAKQYVLSEAIFHSGARVHRWEEKAGFSFLFEYESVPTPPVAADAVVPPPDVIDLTARLQTDGSLEWDVPPGEWTILRVGYSLTGAKTRPATAAGSGLEADKLSRKHMESYVRGYFEPIAKALGPLFGRSLRYVMMDSWEAGTNNWTETMTEEFKRRRGYDPVPWMPVLTGRIVGSADLSDRFLWDFRRTLADLWADAHYGTMADKLRERGIGIYAEAAGVSLEMPEDTLLNKSKVEIPMGEFWVRDLHPRLMYFQDVRGAASAAHAYDKPLVGAESFTGGGYESPATLKRVADYWFAQGVNRIVIHTSAHQPLDTKPGNTMVGTHLHRNITWAEQAAPFIHYLTRTSHMLQQGQFVADLAYLLNEGAPSTPPIWGPGTQPNPPDGYDYDFINADILLNRMAVSADGRLALPQGMSYRVLVLPETDRMRPELLAKIGELLRGGAVVVGAKPQTSPSLMGYPTADEKVRALAAEIWGDLDGVSRTIRRVGKGTVIWGWPLERVMEQQAIAKDFDYSRGLDSELVWLHRRTEQHDIYFVANHTDATYAGEARFRTNGGDPSWWRADTGEIVPLGLQPAGERAVVPLRLQPRESGFVVFRRDVPAARRQAPEPEFETVATIDGGWDVRFPEDFGAPATARFDALASWTTHADNGIKYFSGTATYAKRVRIEPNVTAAGQRLMLDLGKVGDLAEISVNGRSLGTLWHAPYRIDVTDALRAGENEFEIKVTNQWTNRIAGDRIGPAEQRVLATDIQPGRGVGGGFGANAPLPESGLIGPVTLVALGTQASQ